jgi:hypothetical protein
MVQKSKKKENGRKEERGKKINRSSFSELEVLLPKL